jgi:hypothetical protein
MLLKRQWGYKIYLKINKMNKIYKSIKHALEEAVGICALTCP